MLPGVGEGPGRRRAVSPRHRQQRPQPGGAGTGKRRSAGGCDYDLAEISRGEAGQIAAERAARFWPPDAARLPWVASVYPT
ncbi:MAG TPA: hypothetical protein VLW50_08715 [Streptosporangiaceae bacterium]|nr:hypothetical protein [Streptosporangiaceae bacterium]